MNNTKNIIKLIISFIILMVGGYFGIKGIAANTSHEANLYIGTCFVGWLAVFMILTL